MTDQEIMQLAKQKDYETLADYFFEKFLCAAGDRKKRAEANRQWAVMPARAQRIVGNM